MGDIFFFFIISHHVQKPNMGVRFGMKNMNFRTEWKETKWHVFNVKRITFKIEAYGKLFYFDKDGFQAGLQEFEIQA